MSYRKKVFQKAITLDLDVIVRKGQNNWITEIEVFPPEGKFWNDGLSSFVFCRDPHDPDPMWKVWKDIDERITQHSIVDSREERWEKNGMNCPKCGKECENLIVTKYGEDGNMHEYISDERCPVGCFYISEEEKGN